MGKRHSKPTTSGLRLIVPSQALVGRYPRDALLIVQQNDVMRGDDLITELWYSPPDDLPLASEPGRLCVICKTLDDLIESVR
jgi:hypothetical protein